MTEALINKYRPKSWDDVVGHSIQVRALKEAIVKGQARTFLFIGNSGVGKTTLARLAAATAGCSPAELLEIDAATRTGIDDMRVVAASLLYRPLGDSDVKAVIIDECHALSKPAVQSLLKILEEPPSWVYWFLCTTEATRILPTLRTRCFLIDLKPVSTRDLISLLIFVAQEEKLPCRKLSDVIAACAKNAEGSPRQAIANLALCATAKTLEEAQKLLRTAGESAEAVELARALVRGASWRDVQNLLNKLKAAEMNPESVRHVVRAYLTTVILSARTEDDAGRGLEMLDAFSQPFNSFDGLSPLVLACGKALL